MKTDLIERLQHCIVSEAPGSWRKETMREAADRLAALEAEASEGERRGLERVLHMQAPIDSMCMTYRHDFGLPKGMNSYGNGISGMTERDRDALRLTMRQIWEHAVLHAVRALIPEAPAQPELASAAANQLSGSRVGEPAREGNPEDHPRYPALLADAKARVRNENLDGSPRRHAAPFESPVREAEVDRLRENLRANFEAFAAMYNDVNETIGGLPSLEGLLGLGPELQHACSALAEGVRSYAEQKDDVISSALHYVKGKYDPSDDYDFAVYEELKKAAPPEPDSQRGAK